MQFLQNSKTLFIASNQWKRLILAEGAVAQTILAKTHTDEYLSLSAIIYHDLHRKSYLAADGVSAVFDLKNHDFKKITVSSHIIHTETYEPQSEEETQALQQEIARAGSSQQDIQSDSHTTCKSISQWSYDKSKRRMTQTITSECESTFSVARFYAIMGKYSNN
jgi:hypothetical protein